MVCPRCGNQNCTVITETTSTGKDFSAGKGCLGALIFGPLGVLCGACGKGRQMHSVSFWVCNNCGYKWKV